MSDTYKDLQFTSFPDSVQSFVTMLNMATTDAVAVSGYQAAMEAGNTSLAQQYYSQIVNADISCANSSQNCYEYFSRNDDGNGIKRGELTQKIIKKLAKRDSKYQERWDKIWSDMSLLKFKRKEFDDYWLWNHEFYNAKIEDLKYIYNKIK